MGELWALKTGVRIAILVKYLGCKLVIFDSDDRIRTASGIISMFKKMRFLGTHT